MTGIARLAIVLGIIGYYVAVRQIILHKIFAGEGRPIDNFDRSISWLAALTFTMISYVVFCIAATAALWVLAGFAA